MISIGSFLYGNMPIFLEINKHIFHIFVPIGIRNNDQPELFTPHKIENDSV